MLHKDTPKAIWFSGLLYLLLVALYRLLSPGLHGNNGLDPVTSLHLIKTFVIPTLLYSLEIVLPSNSHLTVVETFIKKLLKQIFSLPTNTPVHVPYILSGLIPRLYSSVGITKVFIRCNEVTGSRPLFP
jgi:hypothetical protein